MLFPAVQPNPVRCEVRRGDTRWRVVVRLRGTVQGVGFRPYVHRLATRFGLDGLVRNVGDGVVVELEGDRDAVEQFLAALVPGAPRAARIEDVQLEHAAPHGLHGFHIEESRDWHPEGRAVAPIPPDLATCDDCWREFNDPDDRRYRYPFLNCTQCGPRYTIVTGVPYDRIRTTMQRFAMCGACQAEYDDPAHRRFHAEPNACPLCGPQLAWRTAHSDASDTGEHALQAALQVLADGGVIAAKGIGGYHLLCDARNADAVARLRERKQRPHKPFAVLMDSLATLGGFAVVTPAAARMLESPAHPIVLVSPRDAAAAKAPAKNVAPGLDQLGVMLPAFPLHALLAAHGPLVCTSGNLTSEPMAWRDDDAMQRLSSLVDGFLLHDREIVVPCDDSVVQIGDGGEEQPIRRSRGYAPYPMDVSRSMPETLGRCASVSALAVGAELKSTAAWLSDGQVTLSSHIGDVGSPETFDALQLATRQLAAMHGRASEVVACDLHPDYHSSRWAAVYARETGAALVRVQHHHAHLASLLTEHQLPGNAPILTCTFDGTGWGTDGTVWGGEMLFGDCTGFDRVASLVPFPLAGGDAAIRQPLRCALGLLHRNGYALKALHDTAAHFTAWTVLGSDAQRLMTSQLQRNVGCVETSSMGRLLDALAVLCGGPSLVTYEGQAAMLFEVIARRYRGTHMRPGYVIDVVECARVAGSGITHPPRWRLDPAPLLRAVLRDMRVVTAGQASLDWAQADIADAIAPVAWHVHDAVAQVVATVAHRFAGEQPIRQVGLTGGVFQNQLLTTLTTAALDAHGLGVLTHRLVPCNDGGLALGQALIAAHSATRTVNHPHSSRSTSHLYGERS
ncbi:MAG TPA: carbamoyltransferase HypF [Gemmatimonas sp.]|uniref:carbamoyltransferase HypF n=1 Tax=Gemmatimonas sp. TaxID=1962908 RepID=UPI002ED78B8E